MNGEPVKEDAADEDGRPGFFRRAVAAMRGYPIGWVIDKKFAPEHWAAGTVNAFGDNAGGLSMAAVLPDRWVLVIHSAEHEPCECRNDDYRVTHVDYFSVTGSTYDRFSIGDTVVEADRIIDID